MTPLANEEPGLGLVTRNRLPEISDQEVRRRLGAIYRLLLSLAEEVDARQTEPTEQLQPRTDD
jgi:hypothetical protein